MKGCCMCEIPYGGRFKLSLMGVLVSLVLALMVILPPFNRMFVPFPLMILLSVFVLLPSLLLYYDVRDRFWAAVEKKGMPKAGPSAPSA